MSATTTHVFWADFGPSTPAEQAEVEAKALARQAISDRIARFEVATGLTWRDPLDLATYTEEGTEDYDGVEVDAGVYS